MGDVRLKTPTLFIPYLYFYDLALILYYTVLSSLVQAYEGRILAWLGRKESLCLAAHPTYLRFELFCKLFGDFGYI